ncbi:MULTISPECIES: hypothetical protein [Kitasatospora]|uniref:hypothetical protein n=1 Tax=Kitasatospora TaxID=2063 RepID=UPI0031D39E2C
MTDGEQQAHVAGAPQTGQPVPQPGSSAPGYGYPPAQPGAVPFPQQHGAPGVPGPAATPPPRQGGPGYGQFPTFAQPGQPQGRYGPSTFRASDIDEPDWSALAEQNEAEQRRRRKRMFAIGGGSAAVLVVGGIVAASLYLTDGSARVEADPSASPSVSSSASDKASPSAGQSTKRAAKPEDILGRGSTDKAPLTVETLFPSATITVQGRSYTRSAVDFSGACGDVTTNGLGPLLRDQLCRGLYRATYTSDKSVVTIGVAVFDDKVQASKLDGAFKGNVQPLVKDQTPKFCSDAGACAITHDSLGRYLHTTITGSKDGSPVSGTDKDAKQAGADVTSSLRATLLARGAEAAKKAG